MAETQSCDCAPSECAGHEQAQERGRYCRERMIARFRFMFSVGPNEMFPRSPAGPRTFSVGDCVIPTLEAAAGKRCARRPFTISRISNGPQQYPRPTLHGVNENGDAIAINAADCEPFHGETATPTARGPLSEFDDVRRRIVYVCNGASSPKDGDAILRWADEAAAELRARSRDVETMPALNIVATRVAWAWRHSLTTVQADYDIAAEMLRLFGYAGAAPKALP